MKQELIDGIILLIKNLPEWGRYGVFCFIFTNRKNN